MDSTIQMHGTIETAAHVDARNSAQSGTVASFRRDLRRRLKLCRDKEKLADILEPGVNGPVTKQLTDEIADIRASLNAIENAQRNHGDR